MFPAYEWDLLLDAKEASENTMKRKLIFGDWFNGNSHIMMPLCFVKQSVCFQQSVSTVAELIADWSPDKAICQVRSGVCRGVLKGTN